MYIFKNALKNLGRNRGRNLLLGVIMLAIVTTTVVTLTITRTTDAIIADYEQRFTSEVFIELDMDAVITRLMAEMESGGETRQHASGAMMIGGGGGSMLPALDSNLVLDIAASSYLADYHLEATVSGIHSRYLQALDSDSVGFLEFIENQPAIDLDEYGRLLMLNEDDEMALSMLGMFNIHGNNWSDFESGNRTLLEGEFPINDGDVLMSQALADFNGLEIGDTFEIDQLVDGEFTTRTFIITGLYLTLDDDNPFAFAMGAMPFMNRDNDILTTFDTAVFPDGGGVTEANITGSYFLENPSDLAAFEAYVRNLGVSEDFIVRTDEASYHAVVAPVVGLKSVTQTFLWVVLILGGILVTLVSSIAVRERKYEIGVLRAMGMKKGKIATSFITESLVLTGLCLVIGLGVGTLLSQPVSDHLLSAQVANLPEPVEEGFGSFSGGGSMRMITTGAGMGQSAEINPISELTVHLGATTILEIVGLSLVITVVASAVSLTKITKYEPIKILMERN